MSRICGWCLASTSPSRMSAGSLGKRFGITAMRGNSIKQIMNNSKNIASFVKSERKRVLEGPDASGAGVFTTQCIDCFRHRQDGTEIFEMKTHIDVQIQDQIGNIGLVVQSLR